MPDCSLGSISHQCPVGHRATNILHADRLLQHGRILAAAAGAWWICNLRTDVDVALRDSVSIRVVLFRHK
jgi:hypothetical protein